MKTTPWFFLLLFATAPALRAGNGHGVSDAWDAEVRLSAAEGANSPGVGRKLAADSKKALHAVWTNQKGNTWDVYYARSFDGGVNWSAAQDIAGSPRPAISPNLAVGPDDALHVVWDDRRNGNKELYYTRSNDGGATWEAPKSVSGPSDFDAGSLCITVDTRNRVHVVWHYGNPDNEAPKAQAYYTRSLNGGQSFEPPRRLNTGEGHAAFPRFTVEGTNGDVLAIPWRDNRRAPDWDVYMAISTDGGASFVERTVVATADRDWDPDAKVDVHGIIHLTYTTFFIGTGHPATVSYARSADAAQSWSAPRVVSEPEARSELSSWAAGAGSALWLQYKDLRDADPPPGNNARSDLAVTHSLDGGFTWSPLEFVTDLGDIDMRYPSLAIGPDGVAHALWSDQRTGASQETVYFRRRVAPPLSVALYGVPLWREEGAAESGSAGYTGVAVANLSGTESTVVFTAMDGAGNLIGGAGTTNPAVRSLPPGQQLAVMGSQLWGAGLAGSAAPGWFKVESSTASVAGLALSFDGGLSVLDGADLPSSGLTAFVLPEIQEIGFTRIHVANPNTQTATVTFELVGSDGSLRATAATREIPGHGVFTVAIDELFPVAVAGDYIRASSTLPVVPGELLGESGKYMAALKGQDSAGGASTLYAPQYVAGGPTWRSTLSIVNLDSSPGSVTLEWLRDDGTAAGVPRVAPLQGRGKLSIADQNFFGAGTGTLTEGYLRIRSNGVRLAGAVVFGDVGRSAFATALPLVAPNNDTLIFGQFASNETYFTGLAMANPGSTAVSATIDVFNSAGQLLSTQVQTIEAGQRRSRLLTEWLPVLAEGNYNSGYIRVSSTGELAAFVVFGTHSLSVLSAVPAQSMP
jgi:hypothetical protein